MTTSPEAPVAPLFTPSALRNLWCAVGLYLFGLGGARAYEIVSLPAGASLGPEFPSWILTYLGALSAAIVLVGAGLLTAGALATSQPLRSAAAALAASLVLLVLGLCHGWFIFFHERAIAEGGLIPGVFHVLTLTRIYFPGGASEAGLTGYRVGQAIGLLAWLGGAGFLVSTVDDLRRAKPPATS